MVGQPTWQSQVGIATPNLAAFYTGRGLHYSSLSREGRSPAFLMVCSSMKTLQSRFARLALDRHHCTQPMGCRQGSRVYRCCRAWCCSCSAAMQFGGLSKTVKYLPLTQGTTQCQQRALTAGMLERNGVSSTGWSGAPSLSCGHQPQCQLPHECQAHKRSKWAAYLRHGPACKLLWQQVDSNSDCLELGLF